MNHNRESTYEQLKDEIRRYKLCGLKLFLDGNLCKPKHIARAILLAEEDACYMREYVEDHLGNIHGIEFRYVKNQ